MFKSRCSAKVRHHCTAKRKELALQYFAIPNKANKPWILYTQRHAMRGIYRLYFIEGEFSTVGGGGET